MSDDRVPAPVEAVVRAIAGGAHDTDDERASTFARGLALGALVGAAIAGSTIWQRRQAAMGRRRARPGRPAIALPSPSGPDEADGSHVRAPSP